MLPFIELSAALVNRVPLDFKRYLAKEIRWDNRLIGIKGARGTGKTTLLLQYLNELRLPDYKAVYLPLDDIYFLDHTLLDTAREFQSRGGKVLVIDEVHKYPHWSREIKNIYDRYPDLQVIYTGSSILDISRQEADLSRRSLMYELHGLSFREYLAMKKKVEMAPLTIEEVTGHPSLLRKKFPDDFKPYEFFNNYLEFGYYPFSEEDPESYHQRLRQLVRQIVEYDMAEVKGFDIRNAKKILQLLQIIAQQVPFKPNLQSLAAKSHIHRNSVPNYLHFLEEARLLRLLYPSGISVAALQKPEKLFLNNTNLAYALSLGNPVEGTLRETFFYSQLAVNNQVSQSVKADFEVNSTYTFEVGGMTKSSRQIEGLENAFLVKDDLEYPVGNALPLWMFGFFY